MGNTHPTKGERNGSGGVVGRLTRSHSQECLDPVIVERAMASAAARAPGNNDPELAYLGGLAPPRRGKRPTKSRRTSSSKRREGGIVKMLDDNSSKRRLAVEMDRRGSSSSQQLALPPAANTMMDTSDLTNDLFLLEGSSSRRRQSRRISTQDFAESISNLSPQEVIRQLEDFADDGMDGADEYLHSLKNIHE